jgi:predicted transcriptional regulator
MDSAMDTFTIELSEESARRLRDLAHEAGTTPERLLSDGAREWLSRPEQGFDQAAEYVLRKNRELDPRLA